jgi:aspartate carbamoyltransferase catalytic subunit
MSVEQMPQKKGGFAPKSRSNVWCKNNWCLPKIFFEKNTRTQLANEQASKV